MYIPHGCWCHREWLGLTQKNTHERSGCRERSQADAAEAAAEAGADVDPLAAAVEVERSEEAKAAEAAKAAAESGSAMEVMENGGQEGRWWVPRWARRLLVVAGARCPLTTNKALRLLLSNAPGDHRAPLQPRRAAQRYLRIRGTARADSRRPGVGLAPRPQALPMPAPVTGAGAGTPLWFYGHNQLPPTRSDASPHASCRCGSVCQAVSASCTSCRSDFLGITLFRRNDYFPAR
jgi:hypothetical protein